MTKYENEHQTIKIDDTDYFYMMDNQIRPAMQAAEVNVFLPIAKRVLDKAGVSFDQLKNYPIEGYYWENDNLQLYFKILRNLQHNEDVYKKVKDSEELRFLQKVCNNDIWGIEDPHKRENKAPLKRRYDILTITMENVSIFPDHNTTPRPWTIARRSPLTCGTSFTPRITKRRTSSASPATPTSSLCSMTPGPSAGSSTAPRWTSCTGARCA